jgi:hypothetical protein
MPDSLQLGGSLLLSPYGPNSFQMPVRCGIAGSPPSATRQGSATAGSRVAWARRHELLLVACNVQIAVRGRASW